MAVCLVQLNWEQALALPRSLQLVKARVPLALDPVQL
jgi:hypothetical protein